MCKASILSAAAAAVLFGAGAAHASVTTFDTGLNGWGVFGGNDGSAGDFLEASGGNPGAHDHFIMVDMFGANFHNDTNPDVLGNYSRFTNGFKLTVDVKAESIQFFGSEVSRNVIVELVDYDNPPVSGLPYTSVWYNLGSVQSSTGAFQTYSVNVTDPTATALPAGWGGYGDEGVFGDPILPANRTFADVLASVDEIRFTTYEPGWFYGFTNFDVRYDNAGIAPLPEPATIGVALAGFGAVAMRRHRRPR